MQYTINLKAGVPVRQVFEGVTLVVLDLGPGATPLANLNVEVNGFATEQYRSVKRGFKYHGPRFGAAVFVSPVDTAIEVVASDADVSVMYQDGSEVDANIIGTVPVSAPASLPVTTNRGQNAGAPLFVSGAILGDTPAGTIVDKAAVAAGPVEAVVLAADATRLEAVFFNIGPDPVALGMAGITWAKRSIVLNAGDSWIEARAASKAWSAITAAGTAASVTVQERKA